MVIEVSVDDADVEALGACRQLGLPADGGQTIAAVAFTSRRCNCRRLGFDAGGGAPGAIDTIERDVRGLEFDAEGLEADDALRQRLFAAFILSIDAQARLLGLAVRWSLAGGIASLAVWAAILAGKMG